MSFITWFAAAAASLPFAAVDTPGVGGGTALISFAVLCIPGWFAYRYFPPPLTVPPPSKSARRAQRRLLITGAGAAALVMALQVSLLAMRGPGAVEFSLLNVGSGDAVLITTPHGRYVLVDGGELGYPTRGRTRRGASFIGNTASMHFSHFNRPMSKPLLYPNCSGATKSATAWALVASPWFAGDRYVIDGVTFEALWPATAPDRPPPTRT